MKGISDVTTETFNRIWEKWRVAFDGLDRARDQLEEPNPTDPGWAYVRREVHLAYERLAEVWSLLVEGAFEVDPPARG